MKNDLINSGAKPILKSLSRGEEGTFQQIQQDIDTAIDLQEVLNRLLRWAVELVGARDGSLMLIDEKDVLCFRARFGRSLPEGKVERTFKPGEGIAGWVVQNGQPYICYDTETDAHFIPIIGGFPIRSLVSVPIISHGTVLGVINVDSPEPNRFSEADAELLVSRANQTAVAIERGELLDSLRQIGEKTLGGAEDLYQYIVDGIRRLTRCPVSMWRVDETGKQARIVASQGISAEYAQGARLDLDHSVTGKAIRERTIVQVLDIQADPGFQKKKEAAREGWQSMLVVPLLAGPERAVGTLSIYSMTKREEFTRWELDLLRAFAGQAGVAIQSADLIKELVVLNEIGRAVSVLDVEAIAHLVYDKTSQLMDTTNFFLCLYDKRREELNFRIWMCEGQPLEPFASELSGLTSWVVQEKKPLLIGDWDEEEPRFPIKADIVTGRQRSWLGVPLLMGEELIGVISVQSLEPYAFNLDTQRLLETIASQAAIAIANARLFDDARRRIRDMEIISDVVQIISSKLDTWDLLKTIVSQIADRLKCTHCTIFFPQEEDGEILLVPQVTHGVRSEQIMTRRFKLGEGLTGWVFQHGKSLVLADARDDPRFALARERRDQPRSMLVVPVKTGDQTIGVISADQDKYGWFDENSRRLVDALARHAGVAIERAVGLELLQDIGGQIISAPKVDEVLQQIVSGAIRLTNTTSGVIYLISEDGKSVVKSFQYPLDFDHPKPRMDIEEGLTRQVIRTGEVLEFPDVSQDARVNPALHNRVRSMIAVPLKLEQDVIGVLYLNDADHHDFTEIEKSLLSTLAGQAAVAVHNASLFEKEQQRANAMGLLQEVSARISATLDVEETLSVIIKGAMQLTETESGVIHLVDKSKTAVIRSYEFPGGFGHPSSRFSEKEGLTWEVVSTGQVIAVSDITTDDRVNPDMVEKGVAALIGVPLTVEEKTIGAFFLNDSEPREFTGYEEDLLSTLADQAAIAIENARLYDHISKNLERRIQELEVLTEIGRTVSNLGIDEILEEIHTQSGKLMDVRNIQIAFYDEYKDEVSFPLAYDAGKKVEAGHKDFRPRRRGEYRYGLTEYVIDRGKAEFSEGDVWKWAEKRGIQLSEKIPTKSWIGAPLKVWDRERQAEKVIGLISIQSYEKEDAYDESDLRVLETMVNQAAVAIENARLYETLEEKVEERTRQWKEAQEKVAAAERLAMMSDVAAEFAHRMNNLAGTIPLRVNMVRGHLDPEDARDSQVLEQLDGVKKDAEQLLQAAQEIKRSTEVKAPEPIVVNDLLSIALERVWRSQPETGKITLQKDFAPDLPQLVIDRNRLLDTFVSVIRNAVEAMPNGGALAVSSRLGTLNDKPCVEVAVSDTGVGIPKSDLPQIFGLFFTTKPGGLGFGLWRDRNFLKGLGGNIDVESEVGQGTTFTIKLPVAVDQEVKP